MSEPFRVVVADPGWQFADALPGETRGASRNYRCTPTYEICCLAEWRGERCDRLHLMGHEVARDAALFLWKVAAMPQAALDVAASWDFCVKSELIWLKKTKAGKRWFGMGRTVRAEHEACLVATRGRPQVYDNAIRSTFTTDLDLEGLSAQAGRHSEKPEEFYSIVEHLFMDGPYLELFARRQRPGWTCVGDEA